MKKLIPFTPTPATEEFQIHAKFFAISNLKFEVEFQISGPLQKIAWPPRHIIESRADELWKTTCLEAFLSDDASPESPYLEINCSPNGDWNAYSFQKYRAGMNPSQNTTVRLKDNHMESQTATFRIEIESTTPQNANIVGLTAVIEFTNAEKSYWALQHPGPQPDFHNKKGWK